MLRVTGTVLRVSKVQVPLRNCWTLLSSRCFAQWDELFPSPPLFLPLAAAAAAAYCLNRRSLFSPLQNRNKAWAYHLLQSLD